jgi:hypothetical protein
MRFIREGRYNQTTFVDPETKRIPIISTIFYMDGDVQHLVNEHEGAVLAELHQDLVLQHMQQVQLNANSLKLLYSQIEALTALTVGLITFVVALDFNSLKDSLLLAGGTASLATIFRKSIVRPSLWLLRMILKIYLRSFARQLTG